MLPALFKNYYLGGPLKKYNDPGRIISLPGSPGLVCMVTEVQKSII
jgi:hypothetical protein